MSTGLIEKEFRGLMSAGYGPLWELTISDLQIKESRRMFYAGVASGLSQFGESKEKNEEVSTKMIKEIEQFQRDMIEGKV